MIIAIGIFLLILSSLLFILQEKVFSIISVILIIIGIGLCVGGGIYKIQQGKGGRNNVYDYYTMSDQSSIISEKLDNLKKFRQALVENKLDKGNAGWYNNTRLSNMENQMKILDGMITRLEAINKLDISSYEYTKAIEQLTQNEYKGFNSCIFLDKGLHQNSFRFGNATGKCQKGGFVSNNDSSD